MSELNASAEWDQYWSGKNQGGWLYALIAEFYRKCIIRPNLNRLIRTQFAPGAELLHAGCGSGQVDRDIAGQFKITGMDISPKALSLYPETNARGKVLLSSVFDIKLPNASMDGIYNLGVMEHFSEEEIQTCLSEFRRVLRPNGKMVLFWPPEYGLSVIFFKLLGKTLKLLTGRVYKFHPDEISRVRSKAWVTSLLQKAGLRLTKYEFGPRDAYTYSIIVATPA